MAASRWRAVVRTPVGILALVSTGALVALAIFAPPLFGDLAKTMNVGGDGSANWLGVDALGRDVFARVLVAARLSLLMAVGATLIGVVVGVALGALPAVLGQRFGRFVGAFINLLVAFPALLLALFLAVVFGVGARGAMWAIGIAIAPDIARLTHTLTMSVAGLEYVSAAKILGVGRMRLLVRHVLPNVAEPLVIHAAVTMGGALLAFAGLSYLGLGVQPPDFDWGRLLNEGLDGIYTNPAAALAPGIALVLAGLTFNLLGDTLAQALGHPKPRHIKAGVGIRPLPAPALPQPADTGNGPLLRVADLRVTLPTDAGDRRLVDGVSFDVRPGEAVGIVGESGSGKSLTVMAAAGLVQYPLRVDADFVDFMGHDLRTTPSKTVREALGTTMAVIFQDPASALNPSSRVGRQLAEVATTHLHLKGDDAEVMAVERLRQVRIPGPEWRAKQYPHELSGGMRQRAMIGMALMGSPRLIIADEPTTASDVTIQAQLLDLLARVRRDSGAAVLLVSHDMAVISSFCERVLVMYGGALVEDLSVDELLEAPAHPYTAALLSTVPAAMGDPEQSLATIPGRPPDPHTRSIGCSFAPRCAYATTVCTEQSPPLESMGDGHRVACWHPLSAQPVSIRTDGSGHE